jgi:hypothetical protein
VQPHFTSIEPGLFDIGLWWAAVLVSYLVTVGIALGFVKAQKRKPYPVTEPNRGDKGAGFLVGASKGFVLCAFLASGINRYAPTYLESNSVLSDQTQKSRSLSWAKEHRVAEVIWEAAPVQNFVTRVKERGFWPANGEEKRSSAGAPSSQDAAEDPATTASRPSEASKNLAIPPGVRQDLEQIENRLRELHNEAESIQSR